MLVRKTTSIFFYALIRRTIWGNGFSTNYLSYILNPMQAILPRAYLQK
jgi:hypothetical protein